jgi:hypothetical protein
VDVTYDGAWVLATTDDYLMVVKASFSDEDGERARHRVWDHACRLKFNFNMMLGCSSC